MAAENLVLMGENLNGYQGDTKLKITRRQVKDIVGRTSIACWSNLWIRSMFRKAMARLDAGLAQSIAASPSSPASPSSAASSAAISGALP